MSSESSFMKRIDKSINAMQFSKPVQKVLRQIAREVDSVHRKEVKETKKALKVLHRNSENVLQSFMLGFAPSEKELKKQSTQKLVIAVRSLSRAMNSDSIKKLTRSTP